MVDAFAVQPPRSQRILAATRRFFRWLFSPHVFLALIMLVLMFYMVIVPLYRMIMTTITFSENDLRYAKDAVVGDFTTFPLDADAYHQDCQGHDIPAADALSDDLDGRYAIGFYDRRLTGLVGGPHRFTGS